MNRRWTQINTDKIHTGIIYGDETEVVACPKYLWTVT